MGNVTAGGRVIFNPCDKGFSRSERPYGRLIRFFTRSVGEPETMVNHVFDVTRGGTMYSAEIVEALWHVERHKLYDAYAGTNDQIAIFRPINLTSEQKQIILQDLLSDEGDSYGYLKIPLHLIDSVLFNGRVVARKLAKHWKHQECSGKSARAWGKAGLYFGKEPWAADPDDMWDFCVSNPDKYELIWPLQAIR